MEKINFLLFFFCNFFLNFLFKHLTRRYDIIGNYWQEIHPRIPLPLLSQYSVVVHEDFIYFFGGFIGDKLIATNKIYRYKCIPW